jgi:hypothetical protein
MTSILKVSTIQDPTNGNTALTVDASGRVAMPNRIAFTAGYNTTTGAYVANVTSLGLTSCVPFNFVTQGGTNGVYPNWSNTTHAFTVPVAGMYLVSAWGLWETNQDGEVRIAKNQNIVSQARFYAVADRGVSGTVILQLAVNDVIQLSANQNLYLDYDNVYSGMSIAFLG